MVWSAAPFAAPLLVAAAIAAVTLAYGWRLRHEPGGISLAAVGAACFVWAISDAFWLVAPTVEAKLLFGRISYFGIATVPVAWLGFALSYGGYYRLSLKWLAALGAVPALTIALVWSNEVHGLIWQSLELHPTGPIAHIDIVYGPWFWVHAVYSYSLLAIATALIVFRVLTTSGLAIRQGILLLIGPAIPWAANAFYLLGPDFAPPIDPTPVALALALVPLLWARWRYSLFDVALGLAPIARDTMIDSMTDGVIALDRRGRIVDLNPAARLLVGSQPAGKNGDRLPRQLPSDLAAAVYKAGASPSGQIEIAIGEGDDRREMELVVSNLDDRHGHHVGRLLDLRDVTARRQADRALLESEQRYRELLDTAQEGVWLTDVDGRVNYANNSMAKMIGCEPSALIGRFLSEFVEADEVALLHGLLTRSGEVPAQRDIRFRRLDGSLLWTIVSTNPSLDSRGRAVGTLGMVTDITARKRAELLEEEHRELAYELHDGLAQLVAATHQHLQAYAYQHRPESEQSLRDLDHVLDLARNAVREARRVIAGLRPTVLDDFGLGTAIRLQVESLREEGFEVEYEESIGDYRPAPNVEMAVYRVAQEALANIRKHSQGDRARVALTHHATGLTLEIQDWGKGFDLPIVLERRTLGEGLGLHGMRHRMSVLGGSLLIGTRPGEGTRIVAEIPLSATAGVPVPTKS